MKANNVVSFNASGGPASPAPASCVKGDVMGIEENPQERRRTLNLQESRVYKQLDDISAKLEQLVRLEERYTHLHTKQQTMESQLDTHSLQFQDVFTEQSAARARMQQIDNVRHELMELRQKIEMQDRQRAEYEKTQDKNSTLINTAYGIAKVVLALLLSMGLFTGFVNYKVKKEEIIREAREELRREAAQNGDNG